MLNGLYCAVDSDGLATPDYQGWRGERPRMRALWPAQVFIVIILNWYIKCLRPISDKFHLLPINQNYRTVMVLFLNLYLECLIYIRIEYLDQWCRDLKILYLQSNLIPRIGKTSRFAFDTSLS